jgi:hypothetical protein
MTKEQTILSHSTPSTGSTHSSVRSPFAVAARTAHGARTLVRTAHSWILFWTTAL